MALKIVKRKEIRPVENQQKELTDKEKASKRGKASKRKGATYERKIAKVFKGKYDIDLVRTPQSGGFAKKSTKASDFRGDITCLDESIDFKLHIEAKCHNTISLRPWVKQAESDCPDGKIPIVVFHIQGTSTELVSINYEDLCELLFTNKPKVLPKLNKLNNTDDEEIWKPIKGYSNDYEISNKGRVQSIKEGNIRILKPGIGSSGYYNVGLCKKGKQKSFRVHKLVAEHFIGESSGRIVNHIDGNKLNNEVSNLEYVTYSDNIQHAYNNQLRPKGENIYCAKLKDKDVLDIRKSLGFGVSRQELSSQYGVSEVTILRIDNNLDYRNPKNLYVVCKDQKTLKIRDWVQQAESDCPKDRVPLVVFHLAQVIKEGKVTSKSGDYVTLRLDDFIELVDKNTIIKEL